MYAIRSYYVSFLGGHDGIHPTNQVPDNVKKVLAKTNMNSLIPSGSKKEAATFYKSYIDVHVTEPGWDFTKVDFMSRALTIYAGGEYANIPIRNNFV